MCEQLLGTEKVSVFISEIMEHMCWNKGVVMISFLASGILDHMLPLRIVLINSGISDTVERTDCISENYIVVPKNECLEELLGNVFE